MSRKPSPTMLPSRSRQSSGTPRHVSGCVPQALNVYTTPVTMMNYQTMSVPSAFSHGSSSYWPSDDNVFYQGLDANYLPMSSIAPADLTNAQDFELSSNMSSSSGSSKSLSPALTEPELIHDDFSFGLDQLINQESSWPYSHVYPPTPPSDDMYTLPGPLGSLKDDSTMFDLQEPATECEYLGESPLQFSRAAIRASNPRPLRSASDRTPELSPSGSPKEMATDRTKQNPRSHPFYDNKADKHGYYTCPFASEGSGSERCSHKPTKQKCIYAKYLDSHLRPYLCKYRHEEENCRNLRFSSNACLFRHEREMHGMHNHGMNPYHCLFRGCERNREDNGFPRRWNQRDHMKRVHGWEEPENGIEADKGSNESTRRRSKGSGTSISVPMKRTGSSRAHPYLPGQTRTVSAPRYNAQMQRELQAQNVMIPGPTVDARHYTAQPMVSNAYGPGLYMQY